VCFCRAAEIDRVLKKVDEGVELFDETWEKVYSAEQQNQKEKYEQDLKKEIKKLQRLRDQIKTWISSSEVKDKDALIEARKLIETKMEQFKVCEKDTKTKTYSKEGLAREERLDPAEEAKMNTTTWLGEYLERLQNEVEEKDFEIEKFSTTGKGRKSHKRDIELLLQHITNHKYHISKLEGLIRLVNNERLDPHAVDGIRDDLDYYLDSYKDEEYMSTYEEDFIYETLGLDELDLVVVDRVTQVETPAMAAALAVVSGGSQTSGSGGGGPGAAASGSAAAAGKKGANASSNSKKSAVDNDDAASTKSGGSKDVSKPNSKKGAAVIPLTIGRARTATKGDHDSVSPGVVVVDTSTKASPSKLLPRTTALGGATSSTPPPPPPLGPSSFLAGAGSSANSMAAILKRESEQQQLAEQQEKDRQVRSSRGGNCLGFPRLTLVLRLSSASSSNNSRLGSRSNFVNSNKRRSCNNGNNYNSSRNNSADSSKRRSFGNNSKMHCRSNSKMLYCDNNSRMLR
jgi:CCR4-NOT transcription complex subunit 3